MNLKYKIAILISKMSLCKSCCRHFFKDKSNSVVLIKENGQKIYNPKIKNLYVRFRGKNNYIEINEPVTINYLKIVGYGNNAYFKVEKNCIFKKSVVSLGMNSQVTIGNGTSVNGMWINTNAANGAGVKIGEDCMLSHSINIRPSDGHTIYDNETKELLNPPKNIVIGNHVWLGMNSILIKGAQVPDNCIVGAGALVNKIFSEKNCIIAGIPAEIIKTGINWNRCSPEVWEEKKQLN